MLANIMNTNNVFIEQLKTDIIPPVGSRITINPNSYTINEYVVKEIEYYVTGTAYVKELAVKIICEEI